MRVKYSMTLRINLEHEIDDWDFDPHKTGREMADSVGQMICDEVATSGGVGSYDILMAKSVLE